MDKRSGKRPGPPRLDMSRTGEYAIREAECAFELFAERGLADVTIDQIAAADPLERLCRMLELSVHTCIVDRRGAS